MRKHQLPLNLVAVFFAASQVHYFLRFKQQHKRWIS